MEKVCRNFPMDTTRPCLARIETSGLVGCQVITYSSWQKTLVMKISTIKHESSEKMVLISKQASKSFLPSEF